ncbi:hypothetical protein [Halobacteriovorax sp. DPLXC-1]|uniref:hypothetical protein n=1 Tax=Halobacteriovorax sp. DPLXC-1 TaxID=3110771 RepID=UPI002FF3C48A
MKNLILLFCIFVNLLSFAKADLVDLASESGGNSNTLPIERIREIIDVKLSNELTRGEYRYVSDSDRWVLKTKSRVVSVMDIDLIQKYQSKQFEVRNISDRYRKIFSDRVTNNLLEKRLKRKVKFKDYQFEDFEY